MMLLFHVFSGKAMLLGYSQTYIGVLATLVVLGLFAGKESNFLIRIVTNFGHDLKALFDCDLEYLTRSINELREKDQTDVACLVFHKFWTRRIPEGDERQRFVVALQKMGKVDFEYFVLMNELKDQFEIEMDKLANEDAEGKFVALHLLLLMVFVLFLDSIGVSTEFGNCVLFVLLVLSFPFCLKICYNSFSKPFLQKEDDGTSRRTAMRAVSAMIIASVFVTLFLLLFGMCNYVAYLLCALFLLYGGLYLVKKNLWKKCSIARYNNRYVLRHTFYIMMVSLLLPLAALIFLNTGWMKEICGLASALGYYENWSHELTAFMNAAFIRKLFLFHVTMFSLFVPIILGFVKSHLLLKEKMVFVNKAHKECLERYVQDRKICVDIVKKIVDSEGE